MEQQAPCRPARRTTLTGWLAVGVLLWQSALYPALCAAVPSPVPQKMKGSQSQPTGGMASRQEVVTDRRGFRTQMDYDDYGNVTRSSRELTDSAGNLVRWVRSGSAYGDADHPELPTRLTDPLGNVTLMSYTPNGLPQSVTQVMDLQDRSKDRVTTTSYNGYDMPLAVVDALGKTVVSNSYWKSVESWNPTASASTITFQPEGALKTSTDANGITTFYGYNKRGQVSRVTTGFGTNQAQSTNYSYDFNTGNLTGVSDNAGHGTGFVYDANGQKTGQSTSRTVVNEQGVASGTQTLSTTMILDNEGRVTTTILPDLTRTTTHYNSIGKVDYTIDALKRVTNYRYNALGQRDLTTYHDGTSTGTKYDENGQVEGSTDRAGRGSETIYDSLGRATSSRALSTGGTRNLSDLRSWAKSQRLANRDDD